MVSFRKIFIILRIKQSYFITKIEILEEIIATQKD